MTERNPNKDFRMTDLLQRAAAVRAECVAAMEAAKARTQGEWRSNGFWIEQSLDTIAHTGGSRRPNEEQEANAAFIALASEMFEPALRSTVIAIDALLEIQRADAEAVALIRASVPDWMPEENTRIAMSLTTNNLTALLDAWPEDGK